MGLFEAFLSSSDCVCQPYASKRQAQSQIEAMFDPVKSVTWLSLKK
jgi:hypothetical protein